MRVTEMDEQCDEIQVIHCADGTKTLCYMRDGHCYLEWRGLPDGPPDDGLTAAGCLGAVGLIAFIIWIVAWAWSVYP